ncbi:hypothetical protein [Cupriavidus campinensis]|uniref:DNA ligase (ATP) n=1 Tax=Cupriavidus campinensis TaxID=151783 RepID=A0ABY3ET12_9BURK|nr:hypothetical protein [Cupriavidus campinensis]TSP13984.1 hypothetical protein FGG12_05805 [Cupriavidus campinensis]
MLSTEIYDLIEQIATTSSKNEKQALIAENDHSEVRRVLQAALDPMVTYGLAKRPEPIEPDPNYSRTFDPATWDILNRLAQRKLTGNAAKDAVAKELGLLDDKSAELFWRIISKDLRAGFSESTVNKAIKGLIVTFDCMLAHPFADYKHKVTYPVAVEPKLDGVRMLAFVDLAAGGVRFFSRSGKEFAAFEHLKQPLLSMVGEYRAQLVMRATDRADEDGVPVGDTIDEYMEEADQAMQLVFDCEVVSGSFNETVSEVRRSSAQATDAVMHVFDMLPMAIFKTDEKGGQGEEFEIRRQKLAECVSYAAKDAPIKLSELNIVNSEAGVMALYRIYRGRGLEGAMVKDLKAKYHRRRNIAWLKIKAEETVDVRVVGAYYGEAGKQFEHTLGGLIVDFNGVNVDVGGGYSVKRDGKSRDEFFEAVERDLDRLGERSGAFLCPPLKGHQLSWLVDHGSEVLGRVIEVEYHEVTPDGSLRHPRFVRFRDDKALKAEVKEAEFA